MNDQQQKTHDALRESIDTLREIQKRRESDDKPILPDVLERLMKTRDSLMEIHLIYQEIWSAKTKLEKKVIELENWKETESQYNLHKLTLGVRVYAPNESHKSPKPTQWLCSNRFEQHKKSVLQRQRAALSSFGWSDAFVLFCPECKTSLDIDNTDFAQYLR